MTLEIHGSNFTFSVADEKLHEWIQEVLLSYGLQFSSSIADDVHGQLTIKATDALPALPRGLRKVGVDAAGVAIWQGEDIFYLQAPGVVFVVDLATKRVEGSVLAADLSQAGVPLIWLIMWSLHLLLRCRHFFPLHAAALTRGGDSGLIVTASSGSGKTTLACNLLRSGWHFLSDDTILLYPEAQDIRAYAFRINFALREDGRVLFPELVSHQEERPAGERKSWVPVRALYPQQAEEVCTPRVLVFPELADRTHSRIVPVSPAEALHCLVGQSALVRFRRDWGEEHLALLVRLTQQAPGYRLEAGRDLLEDPDRSHQLLAPLLSASQSSSVQEA